MINKVNSLLVFLLIVFAGADRVNFGAGIIESFKVTPFIILSSVFVLFTIVFNLKKIKLNWIMQYPLPKIALFTYLLFTAISVCFSGDVLMSSKRYILLLIIIFTSILIISNYSSSNLNTILIKSAIAGSLLFLFFDLALLATWLGVIKNEIKQLDFFPDTLAYYIPRLGGFSSDVNRGGFILSFFTYILYINKRKIKHCNVILFINFSMLFSTLSRTTYILLFIIFLLYFLLFLGNLSRLKLVLYFLIPIISVSLLSTYLNNIGIIELEPVLEERFAITKITQSPSAVIHLNLIKEGLYQIFSNIKLFFIGVGHGASFLIIHGYYWSGSKYANFHSQYITTFIESGVTAFFAFLTFTIIYPVLKGIKNIFIPLVIAVFFYNIFYQLSSEPTYWILMLLFYKYNSEHNFQKELFNIKVLS